MCMFVLHFLGFQDTFNQKFLYNFQTPACAQSKTDKICILGLKLADALTKVCLGITFVEIECNLIIMIKNDSFVYQSANFDPRIKILLYLYFA